MHSIISWEDANRCLEWLVDGEGSNYYDLVPNWADNFSNHTENNMESLYEIQFSLINRVGFDQTDNYLDPNAQLGHSDRDESGSSRSWLE